MSIEIVPFESLEPDSLLARSWNDQVNSERNLYAMYQAPGWLACTAKALPQAPQLLVSRTSPGAEPQLMAAIAVDNVPLRFRALRREFASVNLRCVEILGGRALGEPDYSGYSEIALKIWESFPEVDGIYFKSIPNDSALWQVLAQNGWRLGKASAYRFDGERPFHYAEFPGSFDAYMGEFRKKQRYNLKRQVRLMSEGVGKELAMEIIDKPEQIDAFLADVHHVTARSWKSELAEPAPEMAATPQVLREVASAGLLRAYVLRAKGSPAAYALGYRYRDIYHYANIGYDTELASYSPGSVLLLMMIEDLVDNAGVKFMNFGVTDAGYKRVFGNRHLSDASVIVLRPTAGNTVLRTAHSVFEAGKRRLRRGEKIQKPAEQE
jgi:hypothetical protein